VPGHRAGLGQHEGAQRLDRQVGVLGLLGLRGELRVEVAERRSRDARGAVDVEHLARDDCPRDQLVE